MNAHKILWLSDVHVTAEGKTIHGRDPATYLRRALDHGLGRHPDAELWVISGDLVNERRIEEYQRVRETLSDLSIPLALTLGNHDDRAIFHRVFPEGFRDANGFVQGRVDVGSAWRCLLLDTNVDGAPGGAFCARRLGWLRAELAALDGRRGLIFMHHPPIRLGLPGFDAIGLAPEDRAAFADCVADFRDRIGFVGFGHTHMTPQGTVAGVAAVGMGSALYRVHPDFSEVAFFDDPDAPGVYGLVLLNGDGAVVHTVPCGGD